MPQAHVEIEAKLRMPDQRALGGLDAALEALGLRVEGEERREIVDTYVDTADWFLYRAGLSLRVRAVGQGGPVRLTAKTLQPVRDGVASRLEWEEKVPAVDLPTGSLPGEAVPALLHAALAGRVVGPLVEVRQTRRVLIALDAEGTRLEICADDVRLTAGDAERRAAVLEVELMSGAPARVAEIGEALRRRLGGEHERRSKFLQALEAAGLEGPRAPPSQGPRPGAAVLAGPVAGALLGAQLKIMRWNEPGTRVGHDAEYLHDMRVASRRQMAALDVFHELMEPSAYQEDRKGLKRVARVLGAVRDLDVYLGNLPGYGVELGPDAEVILAPLERHLRVRRSAARVEMLAYLESPRYARTVERLEALVGRLGRAREAGPQREAFGRIAPALLRGRVDLVLEAGRAIRPGDAADTYHELRRLCKRLRYTGEFLRGLAPKEMKLLVGRQRALQDLLGAHQDAEIAGEILAAFLSEASLTEPQRRGLESLGAAQAAEAARCRGAFVQVWAAFDAAPLQRAIEEAMGRVESDGA